MKTVARLSLSCLLFTAVTFGADAANMSGVWKLDVKKSKYEKNGAPLAVQLSIDHSEPSLKYSGTIQANSEAAPDTFEFQGAIDDKIYPVKENGKTGRTIKFKRQSARSLESWSSDQTMEEYAVTSISEDGKTLTRRMHVKHKDGKTREWTEVYERQK